MKTAKGLSVEDEKMLSEVWESTNRMEERIADMERQAVAAAELAGELEGDSLDQQFVQLEFQGNNTHAAQHVIAVQIWSKALRRATTIPSAYI